MMKLPEAAAGMVEYAVEHHADVFFMRFIEQLAQCIVAAEERIHVVIVIGVIAMIGGGSKYRRKVDGVNAEVFEVIKMFGHAAQVAALEAVSRGRRIPRFQI